MGNFSAGGAPEKKGAQEKGEIEAVTPSAQKGKVRYYFLCEKGKF